MSRTAPSTVVCVFYRRTKLPGGHRYERIQVGEPEMYGRLVTAHPPAVGDKILLHHKGGGEDLSGHYLVVEREWLHASWGSTLWPILDPFPDEGPALYTVVEPTTPQRHDQVPEDDDA